MSKSRSSQHWASVYADNKHRYLRVRDLECEGYRDRSALCGPRTDPSLFTSCGRNIDEDSESVVISDKEVRYCGRIDSTASANNDTTFDRLRGTLRKNNIVLISDAVGVHSSDSTRIGYHDTKKLWRWILENIDKFLLTGLHTLAMEFVRIKSDLSPYEPDELTSSIIIQSKSSNVDKSDLETLVSISQKIKIIGLDDDGYGPDHILQNIETIRKTADPNNKIGVVAGSGYSKDVCLDCDRFSFPNVVYEVLNLDRDLEVGTDIHFIQLYCADYDR